MPRKLIAAKARPVGYEWLAEWQYGRYEQAAREAFGAAAQAEGIETEVDLDELARFIIAAVDGLIIQWEVHHDAARSERDLANVIRAATPLTVPSASCSHAERHLLIV